MTHPKNRVALPFACLAAACCSAAGQDVFDPPPAAAATDVPPAPPSSYAAGADFQNEGVLPPFLRPVAAPIEQFLNDPLQWGPFRARPHFDYSFLYATRVSERPGRQGDTARHQFSPGLTLQSPHVTLDYTPSFTYYSKGDLEDRVNHRASLGAHFGYGDWFFSLSHMYRNATTPNIETASDTHREMHSTGASAAYRLSDRTMLSFSLSQSLQFSDEGNDSKQWSTMNWADYALTDKTRIGAGIGGGLAEVEHGSDMTYEQLQGRVTLIASEKLYFTVNGGVEVRQFLDIPDADDTVNPLYGASARYNIFEGTRITLAGDRSIRTSLLANRATEVSLISLNFSQRIIEHLGFSAGASYRISDYLVTGGPELVQDRTDETFRIRVGLSTSFLERGSISLSYQHLENTSNFEGFDVSSDQYGFNIGYSF